MVKCPIEKEDCMPQESTGSQHIVIGKQARINAPIANGYQASATQSISYAQEGEQTEKEIQFEQVLKQLELIKEEIDKNHEIDPKLKQETSQTINQLKTAQFEESAWQKTLFALSKVTGCLKDSTQLIISIKDIIPLIGSILT
jgi:flagellar basal body rod protein FlgF